MCPAWAYVSFGTDERKLLGKIFGVVTSVEGISEPSSDRCVGGGRVVVVDIIAAVTE